MATNITSLSELLTLAGEDLFVAVDDPSGTPLTKKVLASTILAYVQTNLGFESVTFENTGLKIEDTDASHALTIAVGSNLTADRTLSLVTGDAGRTITLSGNPTLADWFDQSVKTSADPAFNTIKLNDSNDTHTLQILVSSNLTDNRTLTLATGDANRTITLSNDLTVEAASLINQDLTTDSSVAKFGQLAIGSQASSPGQDGQMQVVSSTLPPLGAVRLTASTNSVAGAADVSAKLTSGSIADGFGGGFTASIQEGASAAVTMCGMYGIRSSGSNNVGSMAFFTRSASGSGNFTEKCRVTPLGNFLVGHTTPPTTGTACVALETETAPTAVVADTFAMYSADANGAGTAAPHFMIESGNAVIKLYKLSALTAAKTNLTLADAEGTPDNSIAAVTNSSPWGFSAQAEAITLLYKIQNLVTRVGELEARLQSLGILP